MGSVNTTGQISGTATITLFGANMLNKIKFYLVSLFGWWRELGPYDTKRAYKYYSKFIYQPEKFQEYKKRGFKVQVPYQDWEVFGSYLTGEKKQCHIGIDLHNFEIKSAKQGSSFEYQYHRFGGVKKLEKDADSKHLFVSYSNEYKDITVRLVHGTDLNYIFQSWKPGLIQNYKSSKQRYRKSIPYRVIVDQGEVIMRIKGGSLDFHIDNETKLLQ